MHLQGKVAMVTGASSGIGKITARELAKAGTEVVMVCRNKFKGEAARNEIIEATGNQKITLILADLSLLSEVRRAAEEFNQQFSKLDILINNAGIMPGKFKRTAEGFELSWATNYLSAFLLTNLLMDKLMASEEGRIINVSSEAHKLGQINFNELNSPRKYSAITAYADSKLATILFTYELDRRLELTHITANCLHPGVVSTNFAQDSFKAFKLIMTLSKPFMRSQEKGAETSIYLATAPELKETSGQYFKNSRPARSSKLSYDQTLARRLWQYSEKQTGFDY